MPVLEISADHAVPIGGLGNAVTVANTGGGNVYYSSQSSVSATSNDGVLTQGQSVTSMPQIWVRADGLTSITVTFATPGQLPSSVVNGSAALLTAIETSGDSYGAGVGAVNNQGFSQKMAETLHIPEINRAVGGAVAGWHHDNASGDGGYAYTLQLLPRAVGAFPYRPVSNAVHIHFGFDDLYLAGGSSAIGPCIEGLRVIIARYRAASVLEETDASWAYTGSWAPLAIATKNSGTGIKYSTTQGDHCDWTVPADVANGSIVAVGGYVDSSYSGVTTITQIRGGSTIATVVVTHSAVRPVTAGKSNGYVRRFTVNAGDVIRKTATTVSSSVEMADYAQIEATPPPIIFLHGATKPYAGGVFGFADVPTRDAAIDTLNTALQALAAEFDQFVIYVDDNAAMGPKNPALFYPGDYLHPNDDGHGAIAAATIRACSTLTVEQVARLAVQHSTVRKRTPLFDTNYQIVPADDIVALIGATVSRTFTLPPTGLLLPGKVFTIKDEAGTAATYPLVLSGGSSTIDGAASVSINTNYGVAQVYFDGLQYRVMSQSTPALTWVAPASFATNITDFGTPSDPVGSALDTAGVVHLRGRLSIGASQGAGVTLCTLAAAYRPGHLKKVPAFSSIAGYSAELTVNTTGTVTFILALASGYVTLDGITFPLT